MFDDSNKYVFILFIFAMNNLTVMASQTEENYLKAIFSLANEENEVNITELSNLLNVSLSTVNSMIKNLNKQTLVNYEKYRPLSLTTKGLKEAALIIRKHRLTEMYLVEKMGFGWEEVHDIAEQIEHIDSPIFFDRMDEMMGYPKIDPHGSPIPDENGKIARAIYRKLSDCKAGDIVKLSALANSSIDFLKYLNRSGLNLSVVIEILSVEPFDSNMLVSYTNHPSETLSKIVCSGLLVENLSQ